MKNLIKEFKAFAVRGNVMDLAVAVVVGGAFGKIVSSLVGSIVMPALGVVLGGIDLSTLAFSVRDSAIEYGVFLQSVIDFLIIALAVFFFIKALNTLKRKQEAEAKVAKPSKEEQLLTEIRDILKSSER